MSDCDEVLRVWNLEFWGMGHVDVQRRQTCATYRQDSQQRSLAGILQADHRDIHLRRPITQEKVSIVLRRERAEGAVSERRCLAGETAEATPSSTTAKN